MAGILAKKVGMTQLVTDSGSQWPVTVLSIQEGTVTQQIKSDDRGYDAVQIAFGNVKEKHVTKAHKGNFKDSELKKRFKEYRLTAEEVESYEVGSKVDAAMFEEGEFVDVVGKSKGRGFQGVIRRWNMARGPETHGSMSHRAIGSVGMCATPSRTLRGHKLPGQMGDKRVTVQSLLVVKVIGEEGLVVVKGAVPGPNGSYVNVKKALKRKKIDISEALSYVPKTNVASAKKTAGKK